MPVVLQLPKRTDVRPVHPREEPTRYYYWPVIGWFYRKRLWMMLDALGERRFERLLEVAYGSGIFLPTICGLCDELHGIDRHTRPDIVEDMLAKLGASAELRSGDASAMPYADNTFDCVVNVSMLEHLHDPATAVREMMRVLKPGGLLALGFPCRNPWMDAFFRLLGYNPRAIHPSSHRDILAAIAQCVPYDALRIFPRWLPLDLALYCVCTIRK